jgi:nucleoside 2-deoxyribosyltransferase
MKIHIVGSSSFAKQMYEYQDKLRALGHEFTLHADYVAQAKGEASEMIERIHTEHAKLKKENNYIMYHYIEILNNEAILVLNFDKNGIKNYIGGNTLMEIGFAFVNQKKIFLLNPIPEEVSYVEEIKAMVEPENILNNDLNKII